MNVVEGNFKGKKPRSALEIFELLAKGLKDTDEDLSELETAVILQSRGELIDVLTGDGSPRTALMLIEIAKHFIVQTEIEAGED